MQRPVLELGLVMAGAAPAGAYAAGVLDFLLEALSAYEAGQAQNAPDCPLHSVKLRAVAGSPQGELDAALFNAALEDALDPAARPGAMSRRALFSAWADPVDIGDLIGEKAMAPAPAPDVLDGGPGLQALILIDPRLSLPRHAAELPAPDGLAGLCLRLLRPLSAETGFRPEALARVIAMGARPARFLIAPQRRDESGTVQPAPLAGPLDASFRRHDFLLGRRNAQRFLARHLALPSHHPAVADWSEAMDRTHGIWPTGVARTLPAPLRPLIPLLGEARRPCEVPAWPQLEAKTLKRTERLIRKRLDAVARELSRDYLGGLTSLVLAPRRRHATRTAVTYLRNLLEARAQIAGRAKVNVPTAKPGGAQRPALKLVPLTGKRRKPAPVQTIGWGHSIDGLEPEKIELISTRAEQA